MDSEAEYLREETFALSLRIWHPTVDLQAVADALPLSRPFVGKRGEPRRTPTGRVRTGVYSESFCAGDLITQDEFKAENFSRELEACVTLALHRLASSEENLLRLKAEGARMEFYIGWVVRSNADVVLPAALMGRLSHLGIALSLDAYGKSTQEEE
jgi:hypothetical protein